MEIQEPRIRTPVCLAVHPLDQPHTLSYYFRNNPVQETDHSRHQLGQADHPTITGYAQNWSSTVQAPQVRCSKAPGTE